MTVTLQAEEDPDRAGHARLSIHGLPTPLADTGFTLRREGYDRAHLGPSGWQVAEARLRPVETDVEDGAFVLTIGPEITQHTEAGPLFFGLPDARIELPVMWPDVDVFVPASEPAPAPEPRPEPAPPPEPPPGPGKIQSPTGNPVSPEAPTQRRPSPVKTGEGRPKWPLSLLLVVALAALASGGWFYYNKGNKDEPQPEPVTQKPPEQVQQKPPEPVKPPTAVWPDGTDGLTPVQVVQGATDAAAIFAVAMRRQAAGRYDDALVLLEESGDRGHAPALTALARLYDPNGFVSGRPFRTPDPRSAARYYRDAIRAGDTAAEAPRAALKQTLETQAQGSNPTAASALREFWP